jgi:3-deoxy-D-manno-octulosonate 8-phosphate phosphatase KdsC-like HAD superfamily phosphatase
MKDKVITIDDIDLFVFDFDGVLTDNLVHLDQNGIEWVSCNRGLEHGFDGTTGLLHESPR